MIPMNEELETLQANETAVRIMRQAATADGFNVSTMVRGEKKILKRLLVHGAVHVKFEKAHATPRGLADFDALSPGNWCSKCKLHLDRCTCNGKVATSAALRETEARMQAPTWSPRHDFESACRCKILAEEVLRTNPRGLDYPSRVQSANTVAATDTSTRTGVINNLRGAGFTQDRIDSELQLIDDLAQGRKVRVTPDNLYRDKKATLRQKQPPDATFTCERGMCQLTLHTAGARGWIKNRTKTETWQWLSDRVLVIDDQNTARQLATLMSRAGLHVEGV